MNELQGLVDALAAHLARPVGVDDRRFRALAYSSHGEEADQVRRASILRREAPREVTAWLASLGLPETRDPVRVPARAEFGMAARICVPVWFQDTPFGYLWLIDEPQPLDAAQLAASERCAADLGAELYRERLRELQQRDRERTAVRSLVGEGGEEPAGAAALVSAAAYAVVVLRAAHREGAFAEAVDVRLAAGVEQVRRRAAPQTVLGLVERGTAVVVLALDGADAAAVRAATLQQTAADHLADCAGWSVVAGVGDVCATAAGGLRRPYEQARAAARLGLRLPGLGSVVGWTDLGAYRVLAELVGERPPLQLVPASLRTLLATADGRGLVETLEQYLEHAGDARATAEALFVHRSSLYGRLHRIEAVAGVDLRSGDTRLELQLGLRLWRMGGAPDALDPAGR
ncbi:PucR family transcriptional regulator [Conexibacter woesei]|uniref:Transcriptional regulator, CdaR n=1 Tax=Conexibacter woesei (strain DSM 14684 / CCUG 47730 / CIP 108061 / JCM 11494 / NBRC 100937 / ID131577) TaxID=469383 RepID=D3F7S5_CONWI|nr:helix-turn-helix domain-containing protein [Conexibacter woesei]ADB52819.1 transcriptional regulator, CdaR [Conexibacter woesei DSM 14684]